MAKKEKVLTPYQQLVSVRPEKYYQLGDEEDGVVAFFNECWRKTILADFNIRFSCVGAAQKKLIHIQIVSPRYQPLLDARVIVYLDEDMWDLLSPEARRVLIENQINRLTFDFEKDKLKMVATPVSTFAAMVKRHGSKSVMDAFAMERMMATSESEAVDISETEEVEVG